MIGRALAVLLLIVAAERARAQAVLPRVEVFSTIGAVVGITPMMIDGVRLGGAHAGLRADVGIQGQSLALAVGGRFWELAPTQSFGGRGLDLFVAAEERVSWDTRTLLRASVGGGFDDIGGGHGPDRAGQGTSGVMFSVGAARELIPPSGERLIVSADIVMPSVSADGNGRRRPILELGFGYRFRDFNPLAALGGARRAQEWRSHGVVPP